MKFNKHPEYDKLSEKGIHAFLSPSKYSWVNYDDEKLIDVYLKHRSKERGTRLHDLADELIKLGIRLPDTGQTLNMYVNDAIGYKMKSEQALYYSLNCFGTADTICFRKNTLRIHDLKNGETKASHNQLKVYVAIFCLDHDVNPNEIDIFLRIYQYDDFVEVDPEREEILHIMRIIKNSDIIINKMRLEEIDG